MRAGRGGPGRLSRTRMAELAEVVPAFFGPEATFTHLAAIAKFLNDRSVRERLGTAANPQEILSIFEATAPAH